MDSASQAVRKIEIGGIDSIVRAGFKSGRTSPFGRKVSPRRLHDCLRTL